jgi:RNA polymerase sigma-70 factor (ECF subfamily)
MATMVVVDGYGDRHEPVEVSDEALVARTARGDVAAFTALYDRHAGPVYALAAHMLGAGEAEEIVQRVFLRLWDKAAQFDATRGAFGPWFMTIARHDVLDELRRRGARRQLMAAVDVEQTLATLPDSEAAIEEQVWRRERDEALRRALRALPDEQRQVIVLAYFGGLSQSAIAGHLTLPLGTVKKRTRLGLQKLRLALTREGLVAG